MNVETLTVDPEVAKAALEEYRTEVRRTHQRVDMQILRGYQEIARGRKVLLLPEVLQAGGMDEQGYPKLAIARAGARLVGVGELQRDGSGVFATGSYRFAPNHPNSVLRSAVPFPAGTFPWNELTPEGRFRWRSARETIVPLIPPHLRPARGLALHHILFEVERWEEPRQARSAPYDPALLRHVGGDLWALISSWDLTELERAVLSGRS